MTDKTTLRTMARQRRADFVATLDPLAHRIAFKTVPSPLAQMIGDAQRVALYVPMEDEAPVLRLAASLIMVQKSLCLPRVVDRLGGLEFHSWSRDAPLYPGPFGTSHPDPDGETVSPDVIIAPLLAFDRRMNRLGWGGGYYDRAFARFPNALRIGIAWSIQEQEMVPAEIWDMPLNAVLTEIEFIEGIAA